MAMPFLLLSRSALFVIVLNPAQGWIRNWRQDTDDQVKSAAEVDRKWAEYLAPSRLPFKLINKGYLQDYFSQRRKVFKRGIDPKMHTSETWGPDSLAGLAMSQYIVPFYWGAPEGITILEQTLDVETYLNCDFLQGFLRKTYWTIGAGSRPDKASKWTSKMFQAVSRFARVCSIEESVRVSCSTEPDPKIGLLSRFGSNVSKTINVVQVNEHQSRQCTRRISSSHSTMEKVEMIQKAARLNVIDKSE